MIGEVKLQVATLVNDYVNGGNSGQFEAIMGHAANYQYAPVALFLTIFPEEAQHRDDLALLRGKMVAHGGLGVIRSLF